MFNIFLFITVGICKILNSSWENGKINENPYFVPEIGHCGFIKSRFWNIDLKVTKSKVFACVPKNLK